MPRLLQYSVVGRLLALLLLIAAGLKLYGLREGLVWPMRPRP